MSLSSNYSFFGKGNWSIDGVGGSATGGGDITVKVPTGSTVVKAYLYETTYFTPGPSGVTLTSGSHTDTISGSDMTSLGVDAGILEAFRTDVTAYMQSVVGSGASSDFTVNASNLTGGGVDGFALVVVYSNPSETERTIVLADGFSASTGDSFNVTFDQPVNTSAPGFAADLSLGIGFSYQLSGVQQYSTVEVNDRLLTSSAGGQDDGGNVSNGGLITVGGIGDSTDNPADPTATPTEPRSDDELYDLAHGNAADMTPYISNGATSLKIDTLNPSNDDNIFFAGINIAAKASVDTGGNDAPTAVNDSYDVSSAMTTTLNVTSNDTDPENDPLTITGTTAPSGFTGTLTITDNKVVFDPQGFTGTESFTYTISDGNMHTATATVSLTVGDTTNPPPPSDCPSVDRPGTQDGSASTNDVLTGPDYHNTFYFDSAANSGQDRITNFGKDDIVVTSVALVDNNHDGIIGYGRNHKFDLGGGDSFTMDNGTKAVRYLGKYCEGTFVYADASVRPMMAKEGWVNHSDMLMGDMANSKAEVFFFDTALDLNLGADTISNFGSGDILVTTTAIRDADGDGVVMFGANNLIDLPGGVGGPGDPGSAGEGGTVGVTGVGGGQVNALEYDGVVTHDGVNYYVYSLQGSAAGTGDLHFSS